MDFLFALFEVFTRFESATYRRGRESDTSYGPINISYGPIN